MRCYVESGSTNNLLYLIKCKRDSLPMPTEHYHLGISHSHRGKKQMGRMSTAENPINDQASDLRQ